MTIRNAMTVDVEDYFQVQAFVPVVPRSAWDGFAPRVDANVARILDRFAAAQVHATFFTLGWVAERHPHLVRRIVAEGHELASHGYGHALVHTLAAAQFRADVRRARQLLEDIGGVAVTGYRAPTFSLGTRTPWAFPVLEEEGYRYSSSTYPIRHDLYGEPNAPRFPYRPAGTTLVELPLTTVPIGGRNFPLAGGGYFRLMPYRLFRAGLAGSTGGSCGRAFSISIPGRSIPASRASREPAAWRASAIISTSPPCPDASTGCSKISPGIASTPCSPISSPPPRRRAWRKPPPELMALVLRPLDDAGAPAWDAFVHAHPEGTFFHLAAWRHIIERAFGHRAHYLLAERDGAIAGILPLAQVKTRLFGNALISVPFCVYGGPLAADAETAVDTRRTRGCPDAPARCARAGIPLPRPGTLARCRRMAGAIGPLRHLPQVLHRR